MEKLDSKSLMVGDWVLINGTPRKIQAVDGDDDEIMAGDELYTLVEDRYHSEDRVEPIPLTPKILEKNGFKQGSGWASRWFDTEIEDKQITLRQDKTCWTVMVNMGCYPMLNNIDIHYVHELQHALRLCGINKEIKL